MRKQPDWSVDSFEDILRDAFSGEFYIDKVDHPVLEALFIE